MIKLNGTKFADLVPKGGDLDSTLASGSRTPGKSGQSKRRLRQLVILGLFVIGLIVCVMSLLCIILLPAFVTNQIAKRLVLKNNSMLLERWSKPNVPMFFKVWVFDVTNPHEVTLQRGVKPKLKEIGPFVFKLKRQKDIVSFAGDNLYYTERKLYHFLPELSCCAMNTTVTIPNIPLVAVVDRALSYQLPLVGRFIPRLINRAIQSLREQVFIRKQVRELLFDGYEVELLRMVSRVGVLVGLPQTISQRFGLLKGRNDSWRPEQDGVWAINTGARDRRMFGKVSSWNSYRQLPFWAAPQCNQINGSDGTLFPPPIKRSEPLYVFNQELCRSVNLIYDRPSDIRSIQAYRFVLNPLNFARTMGPSVAATRAGSALAEPPSEQQHAARPPNNSKQQAAPTVALSPEAIAAATSGAGRQRPSAADLATGSGVEPKAQASEIRPASQRRPPTNDRRTLWPPTRRRLARAERRQASLATGAAATSSGQQRPGEISASEQERLVRAAQEAQLASERLSKTRANPFTCFCDRKTTNLNGVNVCELDGLIDLSKCTKQAQVIFGSMPHFHQGDPRLLRQVSGLEPNASKHTTYLDIEPNTGLVLGGKRRVQLNLIIKHNNEVDGFENLNDMLVPLVWFEESAMIPEEAAQKFKSLYTERIRFVNIVLTTLFLAALGLLAIDLKLMASHYSHCSNLKINCVNKAARAGSTFHSGKISAHAMDTCTTGSGPANGAGGKRRLPLLSALFLKPTPASGENTGQERVAASGHDWQRIPAAAAANGTDSSKSETG